ncbi:MAG: hypothetical protein JWL76_938 [Thermoleophilia bacterium]|nr:hypothetical protein [Thermoleophilia bacterium]
MARRRRTQLNAELLDDHEVVRDAEESLVAALQESDTAVEAMQDSGADGRSLRDSRRWRIGVAGTLLALLGIMVARRRR